MPLTHPSGSFPSLDGFLAWDTAMAPPQHRPAQLGAYAHTCVQYKGIPVTVWEGRHLKWLSLG